MKTLIDSFKRGSSVSSLRLNVTTMIQVVNFCLLLFAIVLAWKIYKGTAEVSIIITFVGMLITYAGLALGYKNAQYKTEQKNLTNGSTTTES